MKYLKIVNPESLIKAVSIIVATIFIYAAVSKVLEFESFQAQLGQSPLISAYAGIISYALPAIEIITAALLLFISTRYFALLISALIMVLFSSYIVAILNFSDNVPCSCGGILEEMSWTQHLLFNLIITFLIFMALLLLSIDWKEALIKLSVISIFGTAIMAVLFWSSEYMIHKENPFVRRFVSGSAVKKAQVKLPFSTAYFAGAAHNALYIGDVNAPLYITIFDSLLQHRKSVKINLDRQDFKFRSLKAEVHPPYFYVYDGSIPVIYRGNISDWKAKVIMVGEGFYFSRARVLDSTTLIFRTRLEDSGDNALGLLHIGKNVTTNLNTHLLQKQVDGFFDTDGMLIYDDHAKIFVYLYYYRNQFTVTGVDLKLRFRGNTIDDTKFANLKTFNDKENNKTKLASAGKVTNKAATLSNNKLYIRSGLRGKYEPREMWEISSIVDIYNIAEHTYISSIYVYDFGNYKVNDMIVLDHSLYTLNGNGLQRYHLDSKLRK